MENNPVMEKVGRAHALVSAGDIEGARALFINFWMEAVSVSDQYQACIIAHYMGHNQSELAAQLDWHLRALNAANAVEDKRVRGFYPSLYASVGKVYVDMNELALARTYILKAREMEHVLLDDDYGSIIRSLIARLLVVVESVEPCRKQ